jgi:hypothetical protein
LERGITHGEVAAGSVKGVLDRISGDRRGTRDKQMGVRDAEESGSHDGNEADGRHGADAEHVRGVRCGE